MKKIFPLLAILFSINTMAVEEFPVEHFFKEPLMLGPQLSPDGEYLAALTPYNINRESMSRCKDRPFGQKNNKGEVHFCDVARRNITVIHIGDKNKDCQSGNYAACPSVRVTQLRSQNVNNFFWQITIVLSSPLVAINSMEFMVLQIRWVYTRSIKMERKASNLLDLKMPMDKWFL